MTLENYPSKLSLAKTLGVCLFINSLVWGLKWLGDNVRYSEIIERQKHMTYELKSYSNNSSTNLLKYPFRN